MTRRCWWPFDLFSRSNFQPDNLDWYYRIRKKKLEESIRRTKYTLKLAFLEFTFKDTSDRGKKWTIPWSCFNFHELSKTMTQFREILILIFRRIQIHKKKKKTWRIQDLQFNLIKRTAYTRTSTFGPRSPRARSMERLWIVEGMLEEQLTSPHSLSTRVERKSRYDRGKETIRARLVAERERQRILAKYRWVGVSRERRFGVGGARRRKTDQRSR